MEGKITELQRELAKLQIDLASAHISGDKERADCLTGKAVGMKNTLEIAQRALLEKSSLAVGELEGMERVISKLQPLKHC